MTFSRDTGVTGEAQPSEEMLPVRGSNHQAFVEMGFIWGSPHEDPRYRQVTMPVGFSITWVAGPVGEVYDAQGNIRAMILASKDHNSVPSIYPVKRFTLNVEGTGDAFQGVAYDWGSAVYRTRPISSQSVAVATVRKWLDEYKHGWDSYSSPINFEGRPVG
jgi:hypothetical protein